MTDCLNLTNGDFSPQVWSSAPSYNAGNVTITRTASDISIQRSGQTGSVNLNGDFRWIVFGTEGYVAIMRVDSPVSGQASYTVSVVDTTTSAISLAPAIISTPTLPTSVQTPLISVSPGSGTLFFIRRSTGTPNEAANLGIFRSDNGMSVLPGPITITLDGTMGATVTATQLIINHPTPFGGSFADSTVAPRPEGTLTLVEGAISFPEAVLNADDPALAVTTATATLKNTGNDCLTITNIGNVAPFSVVPPGPTLPATLAPDAELALTLSFAPTSAGNNQSAQLPITLSTGSGISAIDVEGDAREAIAQITASPSSISFGTVPAPGNATDSFTVSNTGEVTVTATVSTPPVGSNFTWTNTGANPLSPGNSFSPNVTFTVAGATGPLSQTVTITPSQGTTRTVSLSGQGCAPLGVLDTPLSAPIAFPDIQQGFRTVRRLTLGNTGNSDVSYEARIVASGGPNSNPALFGIQKIGDDITTVTGTRNGSILPTTRCGAGATGSGTEELAIVFYANAAPDPAAYTATLEVVDTTSAVPVVTSYALSALILPPVPVDAVLTFDVSGSMADQISGRNKLEAARAAGNMFVQLLRDSADDRMALVTFTTNPTDTFSIRPAAGNRAAFEAALAGLSPQDATNIAGGMILAEDEFNDPPHPLAPPVLNKVMILLTDGKENRCFQRGGAGDWYSITGKGPADGMRRPDNTLQNTQILTVASDITVYSIGLGQPGDIDSVALNAIATGAGGSFNNVTELAGTDFFELEKYFTQIFMDAVNLSVISDPGYTIQAGDKHVHEFDILRGDVNAMVVMYDRDGDRLPFAIVSPQGEVFDGISIPPGFGLRFDSSPTTRFAEIVFPAKEPDRYAGRWQVHVVHDGRICLGRIGLPDKRGFDDHKKMREFLLKNSSPGFLPKDCKDTKDPQDYGIAIGAGSNLRMQPYVEPGTKVIGDTIRLDAGIAEAGLPVFGADVRVEVETPIGAYHTVILHENTVAQNGEYSGLFDKTAVAGTYEFTFRAKGKQAGQPWTREAARTKVVHDPRGGDGQPDDSCCEKLVALLSQARGTKIEPIGPNLEAADKVKPKNKKNEYKSKS